MKMFWGRKGFGFGHGRHDEDEVCSQHGRRFARGDFWGGGRGHGGPGGGHGGRGGGLGRLFAHGDLHFVVLHLIAEKPRHGYELIKAISDMVSGAYKPSPGAFYPTLTMLEEQGYVTVEASAGNKKLYTITGDGTAYLATNRGAVDALLQRMQQTGAEHGGHHAAPQVVRAVENLKMALRLKFGSGALTDEQARIIADALDTATRTIERC